MVLTRQGLNAACRGSYSGYRYLAAVDFNLCSEGAGNAEGSLVVSAWGVAMKMGCTFSQGCSYDGTLGKALGHRHRNRSRAVFLRNCAGYPGIPGYRGHFAAKSAAGPYERK